MRTFGWMDGQTDGWMFGAISVNFEALGNGALYVATDFSFSLWGSSRKKGSWREHPASQPQARPWEPRLAAEAEHLDTQF